MTATDEYQNEYYAGLIDAQLFVGFRMKEKILRTTLDSKDPRVAKEVADRFQPTKLTTIHHPGKNEDVCILTYDRESAREILTFATEHCVLKKDLAKAALGYLDGTVSVDDVMALVNKDTTETATEFSVPWVSGYFDVRGTVTKPAIKGDKRIRGAIKLVLPKSEKVLIEALQRVVAGRVKKSSPCRLVYESKETIRNFVDVVGPHVRAKRSDLECVVTQTPQSP